MVESMWDHLHSVIIGIRFQPNFGFPDKAGSMFDEILYDEDSSFDSSFFDKVQRKVDGEKALRDSTKGHTLRINAENIIFEYFSQNIDKINQVVEDYNDQIIQKKLFEFDLTRIARIGLIYRYSIEDKTMASNIISKGIAEDIDGVNDLKLRFSKKRMTNSLPKKGENDYQNIIYTINKEADSSEVRLAIDFQHYYQPLISDTKLIDFERFKDRIDDFNENDVKEWLNKNFS